MVLLEDGPTELSTAPKEIIKYGGMQKTAADAAVADDNKNNTEACADERLDNELVDDGTDAAGGEDVKMTEPIEEHPFIQQRREKKKYPKIVMCTTTRPCKLLISMVMAVIPALTFYCIPTFDELLCAPGGYCSWALRYPFRWVLSMFYVQFLFASLRVPGRAKDIETVEQYKVISDNPELDMYYTPRWCTSCECWKPPRTHHCGICDRCTLRMDHHCPFMGNCLGLHNVGHFLLMYVYALIGLAVIVGLCAAAMIPYVITWVFDMYALFWTLEWLQVLSPARLALLWWRDIQGGFIYTVLGAHGAPMGVLAALSVIAIFSVAGLSAPYFVLVALNATVLENQLKNRSEYIVLMPDVVVPIGMSFYRQNVWNNIKEVFGKQWRIRVFLPLPLKVDPRVGTHPKASAEACQLLFQRLETVKTEGCKEVVKSLEDLGIISGPLAAEDPEEAPCLEDAANNEEPPCLDAAADNEEAPCLDDATNKKMN
eukprot:GEMP01010712.1.p1 GENE.GEMP01010712.1~~GEMP01010712.1.p1  ORF type:complete len:485 (+),score=93.21 GEMP01010712.1:212-1666(+)